MQHRQFVIHFENTTKVWNFDLGENAENNLCTDRDSYNLAIAPYAKYIEGLKSIVGSHYDQEYVQSFCKSTKYRGLIVSDHQNAKIFLHSWEPGNFSGITLLFHGDLLLPITEAVAIGDPVVISPTTTQGRLLGFEDKDKQFEAGIKDGKYLLSQFIERLDQTVC